MGLVVVPSVPDVCQFLVDPLDLGLLAFAVADVGDEDGLINSGKIWCKRQHTLTLQKVEVQYS